jgi:hypothetical protein
MDFKTIKRLYDLTSAELTFLRISLSELGRKPAGDEITAILASIGVKKAEEKIKLYNESCTKGAMESSNNNVVQLGLSLKRRKFGIRGRKEGE